MFVLGHLGFGHQLATPWRRSLPAWPLALGMLLPDIIDKPLYYARFSDFISCTRTFGHTGLLFLLLFACGYLLRNRALIAVALGMVTHSILDFALDMPPGPRPGATWIAVTWPLHGAHFFHLPRSFTEHMRGLFTWPVLIAEIVGLTLLAWDWRRRSRQQTSPLVQTGSQAPI